MLTPRQEAVLTLIVDEYVKTATPVASEAIARNHDLGVSPATVRNEVGFLEDAGYLTRPHTSAGSIPLDGAYRFYVESQVVPDEPNLPRRVQSSVRKQLSEVEREDAEWTNVAASVLAGLVGNMAVVTSPKAEEAQVSHLELVHLQDVLVMLIVVLEQARMRRQLIRLSEPVEHKQLEQSAERIKKQVVGLTRKEIEARSLNLEPLDRSVVDATKTILREEDRDAFSEHYVVGLRNLLGQPEFAKNEQMRSLVEAFEDGSLVDAVLEATPDEGVVRVVIGQENQGDMLWPLSIVICRYGVPSEAIGVVGAVGPTRMEYRRTVAGVRLVSSVMGELTEAVRS